MPGRIRLSVTLVVAFALFSQQASTQQPPDRPVFRTGTSLVIIDAVVVDADGRHVRDLRAEDFEVVQEGRTHQVRQALYVPAGSQAPAVGVAGAPGEKPPAPAAATPPASSRILSRDAAPAPDARVMAIVIDDLGLSFESTAAVRSALTRFVNSEVAPGDLVAILRTSAGVGTLQQFTTDPRLLHAAIDRLRWTILSRAGIGSFAPLAPEDVLGFAGGGSGTAEVDDEKSLEGLRTSISATGSLGALDYIIRGVETLPGRKSVVFVSEGMRLFTKPEGFSTRGADRVWNAFTRVMDRANRAGVVVYTMDPRGLSSGNLTAEDNPQLRPSMPGRGGASSAEQFDALIRKGIADRLSFLRDSQEALTYIADQTGGFAILNTNDLTRGFRRVLDDAAGYYLLGFEGAPAALRSWDPGRVTVRVKRPELRVRSRKGLFGPSDAGRERAVDGDPLVMAAMSPFGATTLEVRLTALFGHDTRAGSFIRSLFFIDPAGVSFTRQEDGRYTGRLTVLVLAVGDDGKMKTQWRRAIDLQLTQASYEQAKTRGILYSASIPMKAPGAYQLRVAVRDEHTSAMGSTSQFVEVPAAGKGRVAMSGIVLQGVDAADAPAPGAAPPEQLERNVLAEPAIRIFRQGAEAVYAYEVYNGTPREKGALTATATLMRDGQVVHQGAPVPIASKGGSGPVLVTPAVGRLSLSKEIAPGFYTLRITVARVRNGATVPQATQWATFEVRP
jgi:VWFA-related protein